MNLEAMARMNNSHKSLQICLKISIRTTLKKLPATCWMNSWIKTSYSNPFNKPKPTINSILKSKKERYPKPIWNDTKNSIKLWWIFWRSWKLTHRIKLKWLHCSKKCKSMETRQKELLLQLVLCDWSSTLFVFSQKEFLHFIDCSESMGNRIFHFLLQLSISLIESIRLKNRIPSEISTSSWLNNPSWCSSNKQFRLF